MWEDGERRICNSENSERRRGLVVSREGELDLGHPRGIVGVRIRAYYDRYIVPRKSSHGWFLNHSCEPNSGILGRTSIVALCNISRGEQVTIDYSTNIGWDGFTMGCRCGDRNCRRVIRSYKYLTDKHKSFYGRHVSPYLQESRKIETRAKRPMDGGLA